jgi:hypothetical protein
MIGAAVLMNDSSDLRPALAVGDTRFVREGARRYLTNRELDEIAESGEVPHDQAKTLLSRINGYAVVYDSTYHLMTSLGIGQKARMAPQAGSRDRSRSATTLGGWPPVRDSCPAAPLPTDPHPPV